MSLMTAFMAEYDSGEIVIDPKELLEANWYRYDDLPLLPPPRHRRTASDRRYRGNVSG